MGVGGSGGRGWALLEGLSLVRVLQQQVHSLRQVIHIPISFYFWMVLIAGPGGGPEVSLVEYQSIFHYYTKYLKESVFNSILQAESPRGGHCLASTK